MTVRIERAHARDIIRVKRHWKMLLKSYHEYAAGDWPVRDPKEAWERRQHEYLSWINEGEGVIFLAVDDADPEALRGYAAMRFVDSGAAMNLGEAIGMIETVVVDPEYRGQGIGNRLMGACRDELAKRGIGYCCIETLSTNAEALALTESNGFRPYMTRLIRRIDAD